MDKRKGRAWIYGVAVAVLVLLCGILATMQYRWIGEISRMEQIRIRESLQTTLNRLSQEFNSEISTACAALMPTSAQVERMGRDEAYAARYANWSGVSRHRSLFRRAGVAILQDDTAALRMLDLEKGGVLPAEWPQEWQSLRDGMNGRMQGGEPGARGPISPPESMLIELPRFGSQGPRGGRRRAEQDWLIVELDLDYIRGSMLPELVDRYLAGAQGLSYAVEISQRANPAAILYRSGSGESVGQSAEASVMLFDYPQLMRGGEGRGGFRGSPPRWADGEAKARRGPPPGEPGRGRWRMSVRYREGTIAEIVAGTRWRNLALSGMLFLLLLATMIAVVQYSRTSHRLAELQMNFVAGVSHELRTPLTVIRTAAYSLRHRFSEQPAQVAKYAQLIEDESAKLTLLAEQVLRYGKTQSGRILQDRAPVSVEQMIEEGLEASRAGQGEADYVVERRIEADLPLVLADSAALKHAIRNLLENAVKYGTEGGNWIGVSAAKVTGDAGPAVEIRVSDRGPGIPEEEQPYIFDAFYRGSRALRDQVRGTGLGLSLVKKIIEAHGGTIRLESAPMKGSEFVVRLPAAPAELQDEFAHSLS